MTVKYEAQYLVILDADGTTVNAFDAIGRTFARHNMDLGDLVRFQQRRKIFKYLGGLKEFPANLRHQITKQKRKALIRTLTEVYREEGELYPAIGDMIGKLAASPLVRIGVVSRNITHEPLVTLQRLFQRNGVDPDGFDFFLHIPLKQEKTSGFRGIRESFRINPARSFVCGDEKQDFAASLATGMHPFMASYGFESLDRLINRIGVPPELISNTPLQLRQRLMHALGVDDELAQSVDESDACAFPQPVVEAALRRVE